MIQMKIKILCIIACLVIGVSAFLPYFSVSGLGVTVSKSLKDSNDWIYILIIAGAALVFSIIGKYLPVIFLGMASLAMFFIENNSITTNLGKEIDALARSLIQNNMGYYFLLVGSISLIIFAVLGLAGIGRKK
jgi:hypothetical protein